LSQHNLAMAGNRMGKKQTVFKSRTICLSTHLISSLEPDQLISFILIGPHSPGCRTSHKVVQAIPIAIPIPNPLFDAPFSGFNLCVYRMQSKILTSFQCVNQLFCLPLTLSSFPSLGLQL